MAKYKVIVDNKLRGAFGETDFEKKIIRINKKKHRKDAKVKHKTPNKDGSENLATTIQHELIHAKFPKKKEGAVEKLARAMISKKSSRQKAKLYAKVS